VYKKIVQCVSGGLEDRDMWIGQSKILAPTLHVHTLCKAMEIAT